MNAYELSFIPLPHAKGELDAIANILGPEKSETYIGKDALEETLLNAEHPSIIHLATHGFFLSDQDSPGIGRGFQMADLPTMLGQSKHSIAGNVDIINPLLKSGILLAGAKHSLTEGCTGDHDGIVTAEKILGMNLHGTEMVVLSACDTGLGEVKSGEGVFGLRRAFNPSRGQKPCHEPLEGSRQGNQGADGPVLPEHQIRHYEPLSSVKKGNLEGKRDCPETLWARQSQILGGFRVYGAAVISVEYTLVFSKT